MRMPQDLKTKWIEALRSGEYKQGANQLCTKNGSYCCLGVLEHIVDGTVEVYPLTGRALGYPTDMWYARNGVIFFDYMQQKLATKNDRGESFARIAEYIEQEVEGY